MLYEVITPCFRIVFIKLDCGSMAEWLKLDFTVSLAVLTITSATTTACFCGVFVITSYSIHYTKLYDPLARLRQLTREVAKVNKVCAIFIREFRMFWMSPIAYIVLTVFLAVMTWLFLATFFRQGDCSLSGLFQMLPMAFVFVIPALTMRQWAEEKKSGTIELLMTKPVTEWEAVLGKYLATACLLLILLV